MVHWAIGLIFWRGAMPGVRLPSSREDLDCYFSQINSWVCQQLPIIQYRRHTHPSDCVIDDLHMEIHDEDRQLSPPVDLFAYVELNPSEQNLTVWGIDEPKDILIRVFIDSLVQAGLARYSRPGDRTSRPVYEIDVGDHFLYDEHEYEVLTVHRDKIWANDPSIHLWLVMSADRWQETTSDLGLTKPDPDDF